MSTVDAAPDIRSLSAENHDGWLPLWQAYLVFYEEALTDDVTAATFERLTTESDGMYGAIARDAAGRAVGFVHWMTHPSTWSRSPYVYLEDLYVDQTVRGGGVGRALIAHVERWAREHGAEKVYWLTQDSNATARKLYDRVATQTGFLHYEIPLA